MDLRQTVGEGKITKRNGGEKETGTEEKVRGKKKEKELEKILDANVNLDEEDRLVLSILSGEDGLSLSEISRRTGLSLKRIRRVVK